MAVHLTLYGREWFTRIPTRSTVPREQIFIGLATSALCGAGLYWETWFLTETRKGRKLVSLCGAEAAVWVLRGLLIGGFVFGLSLAGGFVNPVRW